MSYVYKILMHGRSSIILNLNVNLNLSLNDKLEEAINLSIKDFKATLFIENLNIILIIDKPIEMPTPTDKAVSIGSRTVFMLTLKRPDIDD